MAQTKAGAIKATKKLKEKYGDNYFAEIGSLGGAWDNPSKRYFAANPEVARTAGIKGGSISRRIK